MCNEQPDSFVRRILLLTIILLMPSVWATEGDTWTVEVEDPFGNPVEGCHVHLSDPWTGKTISEPSGSMYTPSAHCDGYVVMWHPPVPSSQTFVVLEAYPIIEDLFEVYGADRMYALGSDWNVSVSNGSVNAPSGIPIVLIGEGGSAVRNSESEITIPTEVSVYNLTNNYSKEISIAAYHTGSGKIIPWDGSNLTIGEFGGGWTARVSHNGLPIGNTTWPPTVEWVEAQINTTQEHGSSLLTIDSTMNPNENITGTWQANHVFNTGFGLPFIPGQEAGIESQVDRFLDGDINALEQLIETITYVNGIDALCCILDDNEMLFSNVSIDSNINFAESTWGWNETADVSSSRSHISLVRLEVPFQNDIRQTSDLTITTTGEWQYVSSPLNEWISGFSSNFTLMRAETSVSGYYTITLGPNEAPVVTIPEDYSLPWEDTSYDFLPIISDSPLSIHDCVWDIAGSSQNISVNLSQFAPDSSINVSVTCTDEGGLSDNYNTSLVLDDEDPWINASDEIQIIPPGDFIWDLMVGDDHDNNLRVYWTSNKSLDWWYTGDILETSFYVDSNLNSANDNISERHKARNNVEYWLSANVSDDVGHYTIGNWTIQLSDVAGPVVIADLEVLEDANEWNASRELFYSEESIRLNLTESFDDHSSIDKIKFSIRIYDSYFNDLSWSEAQYWELPKLGIGYHQLIIEAEDENGNIGMKTVGVAISPSNIIDLEVIDILASNSDIEPGQNGFWVTVQNNGANTVEFKLCGNGECVDSVVGPSSYIRNATAIVFIDVDMGWFDTLNVELSYANEDGEIVSKYSTTDYSSGAGIGSIELLLIVGIGILVIFWARSRNEPRF